MQPKLLFSLCALGLLSACAGGRMPTAAEYSHSASQDTGPVAGGLFGSDAIPFGRGGPATRPKPAAALGVNAYLWRGALDTLNFLPLASSDPFGGVIITDWSTMQSAPNERFKVTAYILGRRLRADNLRLVVFRQINRGGTWIDAPIAETLTQQLTNRVLARALRLKNMYLT